MREPSLPGDLLLDRYLPGADEATRERARGAFAEFARLLAELGEDLVARENADSCDGEDRGTIAPSPHDP
jgi:hypothetical protein